MRHRVVSFSPMPSLDDTIAALATAPGEAGLCVVRMSGPDAFSVADKVFRGQRCPSRCRSHTVHYGHILHPVSNEIADEVLLTVMRAPRTFTCEDVVEISGHGGHRPGYRILDVLLHHGARLAEPGEFTRRAFLHGRLDLLQAEAVADLIRGRTDASVRASLRQLDGRFSRTIQALRDRLIRLLALVEVGLDFTEEDIEELGMEALRAHALEIQADLTAVIRDGERWRVLRDGARIALVGRPNVGKSSLLNAMLGRDRAIVDPTPGTTRDTLEETVDHHGIPVTFVDTAGFRDPGDSIEAQGIQRVERELRHSDLFVWLVDGAEPLCPEDHEIYGRLAGRRMIPVINKTDLPECIDLHPFRGIDPRAWLRISASTGAGLDRLHDAITRRLLGDAGVPETDVLINARHRALLVGAARHVEQAIHLMDQGVGQEVVAIELREGTRSLGEIIGRGIGDEVLTRIFSTFCVGK